MATHPDILPTVPFLLAPPKLLFLSSPLRQLLILTVLSLPGSVLPIQCKGHWAALFPSQSRCTCDSLCPELTSQLHKTRALALLIWLILVQAQGP